MMGSLEETPKRATMKRTLEETPERAMANPAKRKVAVAEQSQTNVSDGYRRTIARSTPPTLCYAVDRLPKKSGSPTLYEELRTAVKLGKATLLEKLEIPPCDARSWKVPAGCLWRIVCTHGPQVADMNVWSSANPKESFYASKTRQLHATHLTTGDRLWSKMPYMRPLATIVEDTIAYCFDEDGCGVHDVIGNRCYPYTHFNL